MYFKLFHSRNSWQGYLCNFSHRAGWRETSAEPQGGEGRMRMRATKGQTQSLGSFPSSVSEHSWQYCCQLSAFFSSAAFLARSFLCMRWLQISLTIKLSQIFFAVLIVLTVNWQVWILESLVACIKVGKPGYGFPVWNLALGHVSHSPIFMTLFFRCYNIS